MRFSSTFSALVRLAPSQTALAHLLLGQLGLVVLLNLVNLNLAEATSVISNNKTTSNKHPTNERLNLIEADENGIYLLGLFDVHQSNPRVPFKCGPIDTDAGEWQSHRPMQNLEAFLWAIEQVNADNSLLPGVKLGSLVMDTCSSFLRTNQQLANLLHGTSGPNQPDPRQIAAIVADQADWQSVEATVSMASALGLSSFITQSRSSKLSELARKYSQTRTNQASEGDTSPIGARSSSEAVLDFSQEVKMQRRSMSEEETLADQLGIGKMLPNDDLLSLLENATNDQVESIEQQQRKLLMVRMLLGNELLAECIGALVQQMGWDLVSLVYDDETKMVDLHDELAKQLFARNVQLALDEQVPMGSSSDNYDRLLLQLAKKTTMGARVVIGLLGTGSSRQLLDSLHHLRSTQSNKSDLIGQVNSLLWISVADREPFYSFAGDALGTISVSSAVSLLPDFKAHFDGLQSEARGSTNRWWPEYLRSVLLRHRNKLELLADECFKWNEPKASPLINKCLSLSLSSLVQFESQRDAVGHFRWPTPNTGTSNKPTVAATTATGKSNKLQARLSKYLAGGWEHNGMDVINSVLAVANGLESLRQALCPDLKTGICARMRQLILSPSTPSGSSKLTISELMYNELLRSTFQLADGRMFILDDLASNNPPTAQVLGPSMAGNLMMGQLEAQLKLYNLRYLQTNSIGFVKFGHFDQQDGLSVNASKARHYPTLTFAGQVPLEQVKSSCSDENRCLMLGAYAAGQPLDKAANIGMMNEEELAMGVNSLFKLDHPLMSSSSPSMDGQVFAIATDSHKQTIGVGKQVALVRQDPLINTMRSPPSQFIWQPVNSSSSSAPVDGSNERKAFNVIVLLPLHRPANQSGECHSELDISSSAQHLVALAFAQSLVNSRLVSSADVGKKKAEQQIELTTTVIDYCGQRELASLKLKQTLANYANGKPVAVIDFDTALSNRIEDDHLMGHKPLLHLSLGWRDNNQNNDKPTTGEPKAKANQHPPLDAHLANDGHHLNLLPSKSSEIKAIVRLISSMPQWRLVHLLYTDHHQYRDEFVRRANEANICVSKLIWIPQVGSGSDAAAASGSKTEAQQRRMEQLIKTRQLFRDELYDYQTGGGTGKSQPDGLNATKVLVLLASQDPATNLLILEAASKSMLRDYVWISSHEWLNSVEMPAELESSDDNPSLPLNLLSTRLESSESHAFRRYFAELTPALHAPLPTVWFDQFWQQHFKCKLPISSHHQSSLANEPGQTVNTCQPNQHLETHRIIEDERVHFIINAIESIHSAMQASMNDSSDGETFIANFQRQYQQSLGFSSFHIVHRMLPMEGSGASESRRQNSRHLSDVKQTGQLVRVGSWRDGQLILTRANGKQSALNSTTMLLKLDDTAGTNGQPLVDPDFNLKVVKSLARLAAIKSRCVSAETCNLCRQQVAHTLAMLKQEEARLRQSLSSGEPKAISSMESAKTSRLVDSLPEPAFDDDDDEDADRDEARPAVKSSRQSRDDIQAQASSLFDLNASKLVEQSQQDDIRRAYGHMLRISQPANDRWIGGQSPMMLNLRQTSGLALSLLSLLGIICMLVSMTYLYPSMLERKQDHLPILTGNGIGKSDPQDGYAAGGLNNINDYFLLTGLLMLYSINMAFLLPATLGVCWFRRVGLATSYTVIFSAILVKVLASCHQSISLKRFMSAQAKSSQQQRQQQVELIEENVEVTFESLPNEPMSLSFEESSPPSCRPSNDHLSNANQPTTYQSGANIESNGRPSVAPIERRAEIEQFSTLQALLISIGLILGQIFVSLVWLIRQPPEPTLYLGCWRCSSPSRSSTLFLYEPLLGLLYPALILLFIWIQSIKSFRLAYNNDEHYRIRRSLVGQQQHQLVNNGATYNSITFSQQINYQLKDAQSLVMTGTLLMIAWSLLTLYIISSSQKLLPSSNQQQVNHLQQQQSSIYSVSQAEIHSRSEDLTLVYANILSGAIVFSFLFIYRLHLFNCSSVKRALRATRSSSRVLINASSTNSLVSSSGSFAVNGRILKFNQQTKHRDNHMLAPVSHKWLDESYPQPASSTSDFFFGTQRSNTGQERLKLQQFSSYGTYSATPEERYRTSSTFQPHSPNRLGSSKSSKKTKKRQRASQSLFFRSGNSRQSTESPEGNNKLQRRQSSGSMASSTAKLFKGELSDTEQDIYTMDDTISCASSVASSSTSQLQGNDLYPIDCSLQLVEPSNASQANNDHSQLARSVSFSRRSLRRSINRLGSVREESQPPACKD